VRLLRGVGNLDRQFDPFLLSHDVELERFADTIGSEDLVRMRDPARDATFDIDDHIAVLEFQALIGRRPPCNTRVLPAYPEWTHVSDCRLRDLNSRPTVYKTAALPLS
jgi:hypothetical protein